LIFGVGIDLIEVERVAKKISNEEGFREGIFTPAEITLCEGKARRAEHYAARFAAKEAFFKALGSGWRGGLAFTEVEVVNDELGKPEILPHGKVKAALDEHGITRIHASLSHIRDAAVAIILLEKE
jgi:holo-[acyl-carrier protein] synthase